MNLNKKSVKVILLLVVSLIFKMLFPKGDFLKNSPEGFHWLECYHYLVLLVSTFYHPYDISSYCVVVGGWVGRAYLPFHTFDLVDPTFQNILFFECVRKVGGTILNLV